MKWILAITSLVGLIVLTSCSTSPKQSGPPKPPLPPSVKSARLLPPKVPAVWESKHSAPARFRLLSSAPDLSRYTLKVGPPVVAVTLAWDKSPGTNVVTNYHVYYGVVSHAYTNQASAGTNLTTTISNLLTGSTYYFAATAVDKFGLESDYSTEVSYAAVPPVTTNVVTQIGVQILVSSNLTTWSVLTNLTAVRLTNTAPIPNAYYRALMTITNQ